MERFTTTSAPRLSNRSRSKTPSAVQSGRADNLGSRVISLVLLISFCISETSRRAKVSPTRPRAFSQRLSQILRLEMKRRIIVSCRNNQWSLQLSDLKQEIKKRKAVHNKSDDDEVAQYRTAPNIARMLCRSVPSFTTENLDEMEPFHLYCMIPLFIHPLDTCMRPSEYRQWMRHSIGVSMNRDSTITTLSKFLNHRGQGRQRRDDYARLH